MIRPAQVVCHPNKLNMAGDINSFNVVANISNCQHQFDKICQYTFRTDVNINYLQLYQSMVIEKQNIIIYIALLICLLICVAVVYLYKIKKQQEGLIDKLKCR